MKTPTNHQIVTHNGIPVAAVVPYAEYLALFDSDADGAPKQGQTPRELPAPRMPSDEAPTNAEIEAARNDNNTIPHEVMGLIIKKHMTPIRAWREYLGLTQEEVATRMAIKQSTFARMESGKVSPRTATLKKIAAAMGIRYPQLDWEAEE